MQKVVVDGKESLEENERLVKRVKTLEKIQENLSKALRDIEKHLCDYENFSETEYYGLAEESYQKAIDILHHYNK